MRRSRQIRVDPQIFYLIEAVRLLMSNDKGRDVSFMEASERTFELVMDFASYDLTKGRITFRFK